MCPAPPPHRVNRFPLSRLATLDVGRLAADKHAIAGFVEVDVTEARRAIREARQAGEGVSFHAWFTHVVARVAAEVPRAHAMRRGRRGLVTFDQVDVAMPVERLIDGEPVPLVMVIRDAAAKSPAEIKAEIDAALGKRVEGEQDFVLSEHARSQMAMALFYRLPQFLRLHVMKHLMRDSFRARREMGTLIITNVGSAADLPGWILPKTIHNLCLGVGSIVAKPRAVGTQILVRDVLHLTMVFDHDVIDGAPAARFASLLVRRLEAGYAEARSGADQSAAP